MPATPVPATSMPATQKTTPAQRKIVIAAIFGNLLEFYDFTVYSYFAQIIGRQFFPNHDATVSTMLAFSVFATGFLVRPLGGLLLGYYADKQGRRHALMLSIMLMALGSAIIAFTPNYAQIGLAAPLLIVLARLIQGFAAGGELGAATATLLETGTSSGRGFRTSWQMASQGASSLLGAIIAALVNFTLPADALDAWGWRIPFIIGILIIPVGVYLRRHITEEKPKTSKQNHIFKKDYVINWFLVVFTVTGATVSTYVLIFYIPIYSVQQLGISERMSTTVPLFTSFLMMVLSPFFGLWSDRIQRRKPIIIGGLLILLLLLYPAFLIMTHFASLTAIIPTMIVLMVFFIMGVTPIYALMTESFPRHIRVSYLASAYAVSASLFGGTAQLVAAWLLNISGNQLAPAWYMMSCLLVSVIAASLMKETGNKLPE